MLQIHIPLQFASMNNFIWILDLDENDQHTVLHHFTATEKQTSVCVVYTGGFKLFFIKVQELKTTYYMTLEYYNLFSLF